jgi:hypothetical protein
MNTGMNERTKDFFDTPVMAFEEFVERMELGEKEKQEVPVYHARQVAEEVQERIREEEIRTLPELPDDFARFAQLTAEEQAQLLCHTRADVENTTGLLQGYAKSVGYSFSSVDGLLDLSYAIKESAKKMILKREAEPIVLELKKAGVDKNNFYRIKPDSIVSLFFSYGSDVEQLASVFSEVERQIGVVQDYNSDVDMIIELENCIKKQKKDIMMDEKAVDIVR